MCYILVLKQEKEKTINYQLSQLRDFSKEKKYKVVEEYADNGFSGELLERPALDKLRDDAKNKKFEAK